MTSSPAPTEPPAPAAAAPGAPAPGAPGPGAPATEPPAPGGGNAVAAARWDAALMRNFTTPPLELVSGSGASVTDADGREYLDLLGGIAVNALGYAHPAVVDAVSAQIAALPHVSNLYSSPPVLDLAERLQHLAGPGSRVMFANSGTEANEAAFKMARLTGRTRVIATDGSFHGRTMGALALTGQPTKRAPFEPLPGGVEFIPYGDADALAAALAREPNTTAAFICEPIQGESGVRVPPADYLPRVRELTRGAGALLILDEVQTGIGRTGHWFAHQPAGITPDIMTLAKGLGGGLPIGAVIAYGSAADLLTPGSHGSTFAGNPVCAAAALAVLTTIEEQQLLTHTRDLGAHLVASITALGHRHLDHVRGAGLLLGIQLTAPLAASAVTAARHAGFLLNAPAPDVLRLAPPLILTRADADRFVAALPAILDAAAGSATTPLSVAPDEGERP